MKHILTVHVHIIKVLMFQRSATSCLEETHSHCSCTHNKGAYVSKIFSVVPRGIYILTVHVHIIKVLMFQRSSPSCLEETHSHCSCTHNKGAYVSKIFSAVPKGNTFSLFVYT